MALVLLALCCLSSSSVVGGFFGGFIPGTGPHYLKVTGLGELGKYESLRTRLINTLKPIDGEDEKKAKIEEFRVSNSDEIDEYCAAIKKFAEQTAYKGPTTVFTIDGTKTDRELVTQTLGSNDDILGMSRFFCQI